MTADHHHPAELAPIEARVAAIESVLVEKGNLDTDALDAIGSISRTTSAR